MNAELIESLREREKELSCLYKVHEILKDEDSPLEQVLQNLVDQIPYGWQYTGICMVKLNYKDQVFTTPNFFPTKWHQKSDIILEGSSIGTIQVFYSENFTSYEDPFLSEEQQLLNTISQQVAQHIFSRNLKETLLFLKDENPDQNKTTSDLIQLKSEEHWKWRKEMAGELTQCIDFEGLGIEAIYLIGSVKEATAGPASDLDLIVHFSGNEHQLKELKAYIEGWGWCLSRINYLKTGYSLNHSMIDLHVITSREINDNNSFAAMIGSHSNAARLLKRKKK
jgi:predicted nucleotidyltransferase